MSQQRHWIALIFFFVLVPAAWGDSARDVLVGNGTAGPYRLSWSGVVTGTETVNVDAVVQTRSLDYVLDADFGDDHVYAAFAAALRGGSPLRV